MDAIGVFEHGETTSFQESQVTARRHFSMPELLDGSETSGPNIRTEKAVVGFTWCCVVTPTVDGRNPANHLGCIKPCKEWEKLPTSTG